MSRKGLLVLPLLLGILELSGQSTAHSRSRWAVIDPMYSSGKLKPASPLTSDEVTWIYGPAELECWRLQVLRERKDIARLKVGYPGEYHLPSASASFRLKINGGTTVEKIRFRAVGKGTVYIDDNKYFQFEANDSVNRLIILPKKQIKEIRFELSTAGEPPALLIEEGEASTGNVLWEWKAGGENWQPAAHFAQNKKNIVPHRLETPEMDLAFVKKDGELYDFGREVFGYIAIESSIKPKISVGESEVEALDTLNTVLEQSTEMVQIGKNQWETKSPLAFRYLLTNVKNGDKIRCKALFYPVTYLGAFACSDSVLTRIWMNSAYTLRLCMQDFLIDGIKRDRLPWAGDLAMSMMADAYSFGDPEIVRRSLTVLGRAGIKNADINGIVDYNLWWIIAQDQYQLYFADKVHLTKEWPRIKETIDQLLTRCDTSGFLNSEHSWLFIDWVNQEKWTALQILWWWSQQSGVKLATRVGDLQTANRLQQLSQLLKKNLTEIAWSTVKNHWLANPVLPDSISRHPDFLAVISGLATTNQFEGIRNVLKNEAIIPVGTPYMAGYENLALSKLGEIEYMTNRVKKYWGGMLGLGATSFWEAYDEKLKTKEQYVFYNRPYAKSLCHAWSAGPVAILPSAYLGLQPIEDGWKRFSVNPNIGTLKWVSASIPTAFGLIILDINENNMTLNIPIGVVAEWKGESIKGPQIINRKLLE